MRLREAIARRLASLDGNSYDKVSLHDRGIYCQQADRILSDVIRFYEHNTEGDTAFAQMLEDKIMP